MNRSRQITSIDYSQQLAINLDQLDKRERLNMNDVINHDYLRRVFDQYKSFGLQSDTILFSTLTALGAISNRSFIKRLDNIPIMLNHGSLIVGKTGSNKSSYVKLIRHAINTLGHHYQSIYHPEIDKNANKIDVDQLPLQQPSELSSTSSKMVKASFMAEVCTELAITKNLATTDTFLCHDEGDVILTTFGFYSPSDSKHAAGVNLLCSALDGLFNYNRTTGRQNINVKNSMLSMLLATTGSKMSSTLQVMHQKKENVGILGRLYIWHLPSSCEFVPPRNSKLVSDIASIDHLLVIAHEIFQYVPEFRFKKHASDMITKNVTDTDDDYMKSLRVKQGLTVQTLSDLPSTGDNHTNDVFDISPNDLTDDGGVISAYKLMVSILNSDFKIAQQMDEHLIGCVRKGTNKFPRTCALLCLLEIIGDIASNLLKYISFHEGDFSRPQSMSNKYISNEFVHATRQYVRNYLLNLPIIDNRPIIYIDKLQVERAYIFYTYVETTTKMLFDVSLINPANQIDQENNSTSHLSKTEQQELSWFAKVLKTPVIFFSNNYLCKSIPGCAGSGVFKNTSFDLRTHILSKMEKDGLLKSDNYLSATKTISYVKLPPSTLRQNQSLVKLFTMFGPSFTLNHYEKLFETFGLVTTSDATIVPLTPVAIKLLREDDSFVNFYHCLDKDGGILKMIQERMASKEINLVRYYKDGPHRYELTIENGNMPNLLLNNSINNNNENVNNNTLPTGVTDNTSNVHRQPLEAVGFNQQEQRSNSSFAHNESINVHRHYNTETIEQQCILSTFPTTDKNMFDALTHDHRPSVNQIQRQQSAASPVSTNSRTSASSISSLVDYLNSVSYTPRASSPFSSAFFQSSLNINENAAVHNIRFDDLSSILDEPDLALLTSALDDSEIPLHLPSPTIGTSRFISQPLLMTDANNKNTAPGTYLEINQGNDSAAHQTTDKEANQSNQSQPIILPPASTDSHDQMDTNEHVPSNTSPMQASSIIKKKRGRKSNADKNLDLSSIEDADSILLNHKHPVYKRLILLDGIVFSKSDFTHALQQFPNLRDRVIEKLCSEGFFIKGEVFAKKTTAGAIEYLEGYIKRSPAVDDDASMHIEDCINFGNMLATYDISLEEYVNSFDNKQSSTKNSEDVSVKRALDRTNISLTSYLFSLQFVDFINRNAYFSERFTIDNNAVCFDKPLLVPTTSNNALDEYQQSRYKQAKKREGSKKRICDSLQDTAGPSPKNARRRP